MAGAIFTWAESNETHKLVHIGNVARGKKCNCICPCCHELLKARQGDEREHHFAHCSETRQANLNICYIVTLFKLAEQIIEEEKQIWTPSYYSIFLEKNLRFVSVQTSMEHERADRQPDVIGTTEDRQEFMIDFRYDSNVYHKKPIDYTKINCIEIDLTGQTLETLHDYLKAKPYGRWLNSTYYFGLIEERFRRAGKNIHVVETTECATCPIATHCCAARYQDSKRIVEVVNNGKTYRLCKPDEISKVAEEIAEEQRRKAEQQKREEEMRLEWKRQEAEWKKKEEELIEKSRMECLNRIAWQKQRDEDTRLWAEEQKRKRKTITQRIPNHPPVDPNEISCYNCDSNLEQYNRDGKACCGAFISLSIDRYNDPEYAKKCRRFEKKQ